MKLSLTETLPTIVLNRAPPQEQLTELHTNMLENLCTRHALPPHRKLIAGEGKIDAHIAFVGLSSSPDAPDNNLTPTTTQTLIQHLSEAHINTQSIYLTNIVKWCPHTEESNLEAEIRYCLPYLQAELRPVKPKIIVALGKPAALALLQLKSNRSLKELRRVTQWHFNPNLIHSWICPTSIMPNASTAQKASFLHDMQRFHEASTPLQPGDRVLFRANGSNQGGIIHQSLNATQWDITGIGYTAHVSKTDTTLIKIHH
jgi:uracil-DNA glycosylase family 4